MKIASLGAMLFALALTTCAVAGLGLGAPDTSRGIQLAALIGGSALATAVRLVHLRLWVFNPRRRSFQTPEYTS